MTTIRKELSTFRELIEEVSDDSHITDSLLYDIWNKARVQVLSQEIGKNGLLSPWNRLSFCIELELATNHECGCIDVGCEAMRSKHYIPKPITNKYVGAITVMSMFGDIIGHSEEYAIKSNRHDEVKSSKLRWGVKNNRFVLYNTKKVEAVQVSAVWENILDWEGKQYCTETNPCKDIFDIDLSMNENHAKMILELAIELIKPKLIIPEDITQDGNAENKGQGNSQG